MADCGIKGNVRETPTISVLRILILRGFVTEIPHLFHFLPWAAVQGDLKSYGNWFSTLPMATDISPRWGFWVKRVELGGVSNHFGIEDSHS
jgi:hypothetical protein